MKQVMLLILSLPAMLALGQKHAGSRLPSTTAISHIPIVPGEETYPAEYYIGENYRGTWLSRYPGGQLCDSGYLVNNMPEGLWKSWYPNGQLRMMMECSSRRLVATKNEMHRIYKPGFPPGPDMMDMKKVMNDNSVSFDRVLYRQMYLSIHPPALEPTTNRLQVTVQAGDSTNTFFTNSLPYTECLVHGLYMTWFPGGMVKDSGYCDDGIREGVWQEWNDNATVKAVGFYRNGLRFKDWRYYNREGKLLYIRWFNRSEEITETIVLK